jgi:hypothetical protein
MTLDRDEVGRKIVEVCSAMSDRYFDAISTQFQTEAEQEANRKCSIAAFNTGWFILQALGFTDGEARALVESYRSNKND